MNRVVPAADRDADRDDDEIEFLRRELQSCGRSDEVSFSAWLASWDRSGGSFAQHLVLQGVLKSTAPAMVVMVRKGYARVPFDQLVVPTRDQPAAIPEALGESHRFADGSRRHAATVVPAGDSQEPVPIAEITAARASLPVVSATLGAGRVTRARTAPVGVTSNALPTVARDVAPASVAPIPSAARGTGPIGVIGPRATAAAAASFSERKLDGAPTLPLRRIRTISVQPPNGVRELRGLEIGRYRFVNRSAVRTSFVTYEGTDLSTDEPVSLLVLAPMPPWDEAILISRLNKEIAAASSLLDRRILEVRGWARIDRSVFVVTEPVPAFSLRSLVAAGGVLHAEAMRKLVLEIAGVLSDLDRHAASSQVRWPDLDPDDLLIYDSELHLKLRLPVLERDRWSVRPTRASQMRALASSWAFGLGGDRHIAPPRLDELLPRDGSTAVQRRALDALIAGDEAALPTWDALRTVLSEVPSEMVRRSTSTSAASVHPVPGLR